MLQVIKILLGHKKLAISVSVFYTVLLLFVCLINLEGLPEEAVEKGDKIFHFLAYFVLTLLWLNVVSKFFNWSFFKTILVVTLLSIVFGIIVEYLQGVLTSFRTPDVNDIIANSLGVLMASVLVKLIGKAEVKKM